MHRHMDSRTSPFRFLLRTGIFSLALALTWVGHLAAQSSGGQSQLSIQVIDSASNRSLGTVTPGNTIKIEAGQSTVLRLEASDRNRRWARPNARFMVLSGGERIRVSRTSNSNAEVLLEAVRADNPGDPTALTLLGFEAENFGFGAVAIEVTEAPALAVSKLEIEVWDPYRKETIATIGPNDTLTLEPGQRVQLRMVAVGPDGVTRRSPRTRFGLPAGNQQLSLESSNEAEGWVLLEGLNARLGATELAYELGGRLQMGRGVSQRGRIRVVLADSYRDLGAPTEATELVGLLYRAILLRNPESPEIVEARAAKIRANGLEGLQAQAREIAASPESTSKFKANGDVSERLEALYRHLLGLEPHEIPAAEARTFTEFLKRKRIVEVVEGLIASDRFVYRHGLYEEGSGGVDVRRPQVRRRQ